MKHIIRALVLFLSVGLFAQTTTPNLGLNTPVFNTAGWDVLMNANFTKLDALGGGTAIWPVLKVTTLKLNGASDGCLTVTATVVTSTGSSCGSGSGFTGSYTGNTTFTGNMHVTGNLTLDGLLLMGTNSFAVSDTIANEPVNLVGTTGQRTLGFDTTRGLTICNGTTCTAALGLTNPMGNLNSIIVGGATGTPTELVSVVNSTLVTDLSGNVGWNLSTGTGSSVRAGSPTLTGNPTAPTQAANNNSTRLANTTYVDTADALREPSLGNPGTNGFVLSSTTGGTRSWVAMTGGSGGGLGTCRAQTYTAGGTIAINTLVVVDTTGRWVTAPTSGGGVYGVAQAASTITNPVAVCIDGYSNLVMDGTTAVGNIISPSTTTGGQGHDTTQTSRNSIPMQQGVVGDVTTGCSGVGCTAIVSLEGINKVGRQLLSAYIPNNAANTTGTAANLTSAVTLPSGTVVTGYALLNGATFTGKVNTLASATGGAGLGLPHGAAPTSPVNGDVWTTTTGMFAQINGATVGPFAASGGSPAFSSVTAGTNATALVMGTGGSLTVSGTGTINATSVNTNTFPAAAGFTSGGIPCYSSTTAEASSTLLAATGVVLGGGAGVCPTASAANLSFAANNLSIGSTGVAGGLTLFGATSGSAALTLTATGGTIVMPLGTAANPALQGTGSAANTGLFWPSATFFCFDSTGTMPACMSLAGYRVGTGAAFSFSTTASANASQGANIGVVGSSTTENMNPSSVMLMPQCKIVGAITLSTTATTICSWTLPNSAQTWSWRCNIAYAITAGTTPTFALGMTASVAPTNETGYATIYSTNTGTSTQGTATASTTANTTILTGATTATGTFQASTFGTIQAAAGTGTFTITGLLGGTTPAGTIPVGSSCELY